MAVSSPIHGKNSTFTFEGATIGTVTDVSMTLDYNASNSNKYVGVDHTGDRTVVVAMTVDPKTGVMTIDDAHVLESSTTTIPDDATSKLFNFNQPTHLWGCGICTCGTPDGNTRGLAAQEVMAEWMEDLSTKELATMILLLPAGNGVREMARYALRQKDPYDTTKSQE